MALSGEVSGGGGTLSPSRLLPEAMHRPALLVVLWVVDQQVGVGCSLLVTAAV